MKNLPIINKEKFQIFMHRSRIVHVFRRFFIRQVFSDEIYNSSISFRYFLIIIIH